MKTTTIKTLAEVLKQGNSTTNQRIKEKFVSQHVYANVNTMVEYIINKGFEDSDAPFTIEDVSNYYTYPEYTGEYANFEGGSEEEKQKEIERLKGIIENQINDDNTDIETDIEALENLESEPQEVFEWWMVSNYLAEKLNEYGECIIDSENIWGRTTTGQAILLDYVITKICADMEILEGQQNSWA